jgi:hypothetical protein
MNFKWHDSSEALPITELERDNWVLDHLTEKEMQPIQERAKTSYSACGDSLVLLVRNPSGYVDVYDCKVRRRTTVTANQIIKLTAQPQPFEKHGG